MYYSEKVRKQKIEELKDNKEFLEYARKRYEDCKESGAIGGSKTFEEYLLDGVIDLYEDFTLLEFMKKSDKTTVNFVMEEALKGILDL